MTTKIAHGGVIPSGDACPAPGRARLVRGGFTLVEVVISMVILSLIGLIFVDAMVNAARSMTLYERRRESVFMVDFALKRLLKDCRYIKRGGMSVAQADRMEFMDSFGRSVVYRLDGTDLQLGLGGAAPANLARDIAVFTIRYFDKTNTELPTPVSNPVDVHWLEVTVQGTAANMNYGNSIQVFPREMYR